MNPYSTFEFRGPGTNSFRYFTPFNVLHRSWHIIILVVAQCTAMAIPGTQGNSLQEVSIEISQRAASTPTSAMRLEGSKALDERARRTVSPRVFYDAGMRITCGQPREIVTRRPDPDDLANPLLDIGDWDSFQNPLASHSENLQMVVAGIRECLGGCACDLDTGELKPPARAETDPDMACGTPRKLAICVHVNPHLQDPSYAFIVSQPVSYRNIPSFLQALNAIPENVRVLNPLYYWTPPPYMRDHEGQMFTWQGNPFLTHGPGGELNEESLPADPLADEGLNALSALPGANQAVVPGYSPEVPLEEILGPLPIGAPFEEIPRPEPTAESQGLPHEPYPMYGPEDEGPSRPHPYVNGWEYMMNGKPPFKRSIEVKAISQTNAASQGGHSHAVNQ
ncbi:hypothetical protein TWF718_008515 [Orbilia javanica]|uniref:Uncharacterized protein n=1 Tax=Orbilia javanica TaxID=47235 RepID=A0AAN8N5G1_9PEZI